MSEGNYVLAMYDIRGKQEYIYRSNRIKEIVGGSYIIRDCFDDYLFPAAREISKKGIFSYRREHPKEEPDNFTPENFKKRLESGYIGEVIYDGGGNFFVLYENVERYREVNRRFYHSILEKTYSLRVLTTYVDRVDLMNYPGDRERLYAKHRKREQQETLLAPVNTLPFVQTDYRTSLPLEELCFTGENKEKVSLESAGKYKKYAEIEERMKENQQIQECKYLDHLITEKGEESLLAVIYIDGNNMGAQVERCLSGRKTYEECTEALRRFSDEIQKHYIDERIKDADALLEKKEVSKYRFVIHAGDEITLICNARNAYDVAVNYLTSLAEDSPADVLRTSCAGIAVFHSHAPFADAYRIAEECCESGKKLMKEEGIDHASLIDFHYCQGAFGTSLEEIRREEETTDSSHPWFIISPDNQKGTGLVKGKYVSEEIVEQMKDMMNLAGRSNIKSLAVSARKSSAAFRSEIERIRAHQLEKNIDFSLGGLLDDEMQQKLIYDMAIVYDIWFRPMKEKGKTEDEK